MKKLNIIKQAAKYTLKGVDSKFNDAFSKFMEGARAIVDEEYKDSPDFAKPILIYTDGKKYVRVLSKATQTMAFCFIDKTNGDVLKPATGKTVVPGARGNIFDNKGGLGWVTPWGMELKR